MAQPAAAPLPWRRLRDLPSHSQEGELGAPEATSLRNSWELAAGALGVVAVGDYGGGAVDLQKAVPTERHEEAHSRRSCQETLHTSCR